MFKAIVFACSLSSPTDCWEFYDTRGPYETYAQCQNRAYEMGSDIMAMNLPHSIDLQPKKFKCKQLKGTAL